ncbi:MAG TPA: 2,3-diphosphoglycerate-dependent phosphoglycerate mutase [Candidatus Saccharimonadia bacterium]|nr:2,3-diphosphoglycerate-dependent phosphoglycerate mutase [Candidatus Saccharimonadia bacterium]
MTYLILARHGESQFNAKSLWTGTWDVPLTKKGRRQATLMAKAVKDLKPKVAYTSLLSRAHETLDIIASTNKWARLTIRTAGEFNERNYGDLTGMNKWAVEEQYGEKQFNKWRRGWDEPVPDGETLKMVFRRVVPYYEQHVEPDLAHGKDVLIVAHGNSLRALIKYLDELSDRQVEALEMPFGEVLVYEMDNHCHVKGKEVRKLEPDDTAA